MPLNNELPNKRPRHHETIAHVDSCPAFHQGAQPHGGAVQQLKLDKRLQDLMFPARNWHQTFCGPYDGSDAVKQALMHAGDALAATKMPAFVLSLNRIRGEGGRQGIHWSFFARGRPRPFDEVLAVLKDEVVRQGLEADGGHRPHVTICYRASETLETQAITPIDWVIDELLLAERTGTGNGWTYQILHRWKLPNTAI
ncbi:2'-5' RNA ligase family protein [Diaphorobacter aerolatus]|uniref:2'-5' RNA ligase family protein n=1 Tax=Diaphorobacter aerolatus TaxID=1288495 RepID=A0A7H0GL49_9BURK|nr:2'-5' RNA ligase family protein [Diaphorobacter aerolatus]QNP49015.1 2'-5' RNA ligase family protein [Diaphorobacter aerolatus]